MKGIELSQIRLVKGGMNWREQEIDIISCLQIVSIYFSILTKGMNPIIHQWFSLEKAH